MFTDHNIACDLFMEHRNWLCKQAVAGLWSNRTEDAMICYWILMKSYKLQILQEDALFLQMIETLEW